MCLGTASHRNWRNMPHTENRQQHNRDGENLTKIDYQNKRRVDWKEWNLMRIFCWLVPARRVVLRSVYLGSQSDLISICSAGWDVKRESNRRTNSHKTRYSYTHQFKWAVDGKCILPTLLVPIDGEATRLGKCNELRRYLRNKFLGKFDELKFFLFESFWEKCKRMNVL